MLQSMSSTVGSVFIGHPLQLVPKLLYGMLHFTMSYFNSATFFFFFFTLIDFEEEEFPSRET